MPAVNNVLVVGSGLAGAATAIKLAAAGVAVDLVEIKPDLAAVGSGITLQGNALRELRDLGLDLDEVDRDPARGEVDGDTGAGEAGADHEDVAHCGHGNSYFTAMGLTGEPTAPVMGRGRR